MTAFETLPYHERAQAAEVALDRIARAYWAWATDEVNDKQASAALATALVEYERATGRKLEACWLSPEGD